MNEVKAHNIRPEPNAFITFCNNLIFVLQIKIIRTLDIKINSCFELPL